MPPMGAMISHVAIMIRIIQGELLRGDEERGGKKRVKTETQSHREGRDEREGKEKQREARRAPS